MLFKEGLEFLTYECLYSRKLADEAQLAVSKLYEDIVLEKLNLPTIWPINSMETYHLKSHGLF